MASSTDVAGSPQAGSLTGTTYSNLGMGNYTLSETGGPSGYSAAFSGDCNSGGMLTLATSSGMLTCTVTNTFLASTTPGTLDVMKLVNGGAATSSNFMIHVWSNASSSEVMGSPQMGSATGTVYSLVPGWYLVFETGGPSGYSLSYSGDCSQGWVLVSASSSKSCTLNNTFTAI
jgi:uncharacterized surface anchored protein